MSPEDVEGIERATLVALAPARTLEIDGWLAGFDVGTIGRSRSAVPLRHDIVSDPATLDRLEAAFGEHGLDPRFRVADAAGLADIRASLSARGYGPSEPTLVKVGGADGLVGLSDTPAEILPSPDGAWRSVFAGEGFDEADGAFRATALNRGQDAIYAQVRNGDSALAVGVAAFGHGWASIHGMRTLRACRGQGLAGRILSGLARAALARGVTRVFLQVEEDNASARALYRRAGLTPAWRYRYWCKPD